MFSSSFASFKPPESGNDGAPFLGLQIGVIPLTNTYRKKKVHYSICRRAGIQFKKQLLSRFQGWL
jgi:hypothetical protein